MQTKHILGVAMLAAAAIAGGEAMAKCKAKIEIQNNLNADIKAIWVKSGKYDDAANKLEWPSGVNRSVKDRRVGANSTRTIEWSIFRKDDTDAYLRVYYKVANKKGKFKGRAQSVETKRWRSCSDTQAGYRHKIKIGG